MAVSIKAQRVECTELEVVYVYQNDETEGRVRIPVDDPDSFVVEAGTRFSAVRVMGNAYIAFRNEGLWPENFYIAS